MEDDARKISFSENEKYPIITKYEQYYEEDEICVLPSTELIPDEYEHKHNKKGLVLVFYSNLDFENKEVIVKEFSDQGYDVTNVFRLTTRDFVLGQLAAVTQENHQDKTCLIIFFLGTAEKENMFLLDDEDDNHILLKEVWLNFTATNCPSFRKKPKIFVFQATKKPIVSTFDARHFAVAPKGAYNVPSEADMLLIYRRVENSTNRQIFIKELCNKIDKYGKRDDIIGLVTRTTQNERRPLIISTLTRKFYVTSSDQRGYYYDLHLNHKNTIKILENLRKFVSAKTSYENDKKSYTVQVELPAKSKSLKSDTNRAAKVKSEKSQDRPPWR